jgi:PAS domain S-box-containing protein
MKKSRFSICQAELNLADAMKTYFHPIKLYYLNCKQSNRMVVSRFLEESGTAVQIEVFSSTDELRNKILFYPPEVIIADHDEECKFARETVAFIKDINLNIPVILLTNFASEEGAISILKEGACDYVFIEKPLRLISALEKITQKERILQYTVQQLDNSTREFTELAENLPFALGIWNTDNKLKHFNRALLQLLFVNGEVFSGHKLSNETIQLFTNSNERIPFEKNILDVCTTKGHAVVKEDLTLRSPNGTKRFVSVIATPVRNSIGEIQSIAVMFIDLTEQRTANNKAKSLSELVQFKNNELSQFAYIISHNLRDPIAKILGLASICEAESEDSRFFLQKIKEEADRLDSIVKDLNVLLSVRNAEKEKREELNFDRELAVVSQVLQKELMESGAVIEVDFRKAETVETVKTYLQSVLYNLISNSVKYRKPEDVLRIHITTNSDDDYVWLSVKDNGMGIDLTRNGDKIFGLYKRFHPYNIPGKGVGLHFVKSYVEALGGKVTIDSRVNEGTEVKVYFKRPYNHDEEQKNSFD